MKPSPVEPIRVELSRDEPSRAESRGVGSRRVEEPCRVESIQVELSRGEPSRAEVCSGRVETRRIESIKSSVESRCVGVASRCVGVESKQFV